MTNRTFRREQSPRRPPGQGLKSASHDVLPPLPPMPPGYTLRKQAPASSRRSFSLGPPAPVRPISPPTRSGHTRGVSMDREVTRSPTRQAPSLRSVPEIDRPASRNSINFSYPMNSRPNSPPPSPPGHRGLAAASLAQQISPGSSPRSQVTRDRRIVSTGTVKAAQAPVGTAVAAAQAATIPGTAVPRRQAPAPAPVPAPALVAVPSHPTTTNTTAAAAAAAIRQPPVAPGKPRGEVLAKEAGSTLGNGNTTHHPPVKQSPPRVEQNPVPPIRTIVTPEPQIIQSPPTPEDANVQLSSQPVIASPPSNQSVEPQREPTKPWVRQPSSSPGRSARFSSQLTAGDLRLHHPPPRSVSPVKSALKHTSQGSLSPDRVPASIARPGPSSELSDGTSVTSDDGFRPGNSKRKSAKVSFDDEAEVVGVAASPPTSPEDMLPESPPGRSRSKATWFGVGKKKPSPFDNADEFDEVLKPRRALPSFGSVRAGRDGDIPEPPPQEDPNDNESVTSSASTTHDDNDDGGNGNGEVVPGWSVSNDHAIGAILAQESPETPKLAEPIDHPPLPTSPQSDDSPTSADLAEEYMSELPPGWVEGMHTSDYNLAQNPAAETTTAASDTAAPAPALAPTPAESGAAAPVDNVESLSSLENARRSVDGYDVSGNFPQTSLDVDRGSTLPPTKRKSRDSTVSGSGTVTESGNPTANGNGVEDVSDSDSFYSDAAEDFDEGDGFGSINAIVGGQPEQTNQTGMAVDKTRPTPLSTREELPSVPEESQTIGRAVSPPLNAGPHWVPDSPDTVDELLPFPSPYPPFPLKRKPTKPKPPPVKVSQTNSNGQRAKRPVSMGAAPISHHGTMTANSVTIPRENSSRTIMSTGPPPQKMGTERRRPVSLGPVLPNSAGRRHDSPQRPTTSNGIAQSEHRSPEPGGTIGHSMRRTLRTTTDNIQNSRTMPEDARPTSAGSGTGTGPMRSTLRGSPSKGGSKTTFFSTRKSVSKSPTRKKVTRGPGPLFSSRFDDSDDDGYGPDDRAQNFRSRFADSSDEEDGPRTNTLRPVRGIPRRHGKEDGESTELEDSSDDEGRRRTQLGAAAATGATNTTASTTGAAASATNKDNNSAAQSNRGLAAVARSRGVSPEELEDFLHHQPSRKLGIFSRFNLRKSKNNEAKQLRKSTPEATTTAAVSPDPIMQHHRGGSVTTTVTANGNDTSKPRRVSKLVNNNHRQKSAEESWPLRSNQKADEDEEEAVATETKTSAPIHDATINDGDEVAKRSTAVEPPSNTSVAPLAPTPEPASTSPTAKSQLAGEGSHFPKHEDDDGNNNKNNNNNDHNDSVTSARDVVIAGSERKKRFPKLRRAFGLR